VDYLGDRHPVHEKLPTILFSTADTPFYVTLAVPKGSFLHILTHTCYGLVFLVVAFSVSERKSFMVLMCIADGGYKDCLQNPKEGVRGNRVSAGARTLDPKHHEPPVGGTGGQFCWHWLD
jgi:hypothetical protein